MISKDDGRSPFAIDPGSAHGSEVLTYLASSKYEIEFPERRSTSKGVGFDVSEERHRK
jgi:hypothetical protein